jgi:glycosyltransferase involved in cell wall biosynthesis
MLSVCITTHNSEKWLVRQIKSILCQLAENDEVIVSDDNSTDRTLEILCSLDDRRIKIFEFVPKKSYRFVYERITANVANALKHATGSLIFLADHDDVWHENKVEAVKAQIGSHLALVHNCRVIDENGNEISPSYFQMIGAKKGILKNIIKCSYLGCCMAITGGFLKQVLPLPENVPHDLWLALLAEKQNSLLMIDNKLIDYQRHSNTFSSAGKKSDKSLFFKIYYRYNIVKELVRRLK